MAVDKQVHAFHVMGLLSYLALGHSIIAGGFILYKHYSEEDRRILEYENKVKTIEIDLQNDRKMRNEMLRKMQKENADLKFRNKLLGKINKNVKCRIKKSKEENKNLLCKNKSLEESNKLLLDKFRLLEDKLEDFKIAPMPTYIESDSDDDSKLVETCRSRLTSMKNQLSEMATYHRKQVVAVRRVSVAQPPPPPPQQPLLKTMSQPCKLYREAEIKERPKYRSSDVRPFY